jgi:protein TonB
MGFVLPFHASYPFIYTGPAVVTSSISRVPAMRRNVVVAFSVVALHVGFGYVLYNGLLTRVVELVVPILALSQFIEPPQPAVAAPAPAPPTAPTRVRKTTAGAPVVAAQLPAAIRDPTPAPNAPLGEIAPQPAPVTIATPRITVATTVTTAAVQSAPPVLQPPSSAADYLQNPKPAYPAISRRLNEQGKTTVRVLIGADGQPQQAEIGKSSGFSRLDDAALATVMRWRYVPGKRGGLAEAMWFNVPINWVLE